jgi:hypothetical protein
LENGIRTWTKTNSGEQATQTATYTISNPASGTGNECTNKNDDFKSKDCNTSISCPYYSDVVKTSCPDNYSNSTPGMCIENCRPGYTLSGGMCNGPQSYVPVNGGCRPGDSNYGLMCRSTPYAPVSIQATCPINYSHSTVGLCTKNCDSGYTLKGNICSLSST